MNKVVSNIAMQTPGKIAVVEFIETTQEQICYDGGFDRLNHRVVIKVIAPKIAKSNDLDKIK